MSPLSKQKIYFKSISPWDDYFLWEDLPSLWLSLYDGWGTLCQEGLLHAPCSPDPHMEQGYRTGGLVLQGTETSARKDFFHGRLFHEACSVFCHSKPGWCQKEPYRAGSSWKTTESGSSLTPRQQTEQLSPINKKTESKELNLDSPLIHILSSSIWSMGLI